MKLRTGENCYRLWTVALFVPRRIGVGLDLNLRVKAIPASRYFIKLEARSGGACAGVIRQGVVYKDATEIKKRADRLVVTSVAVRADVQRVVRASGRRLIARRWTDRIGAKVSGIVRHRHDKPVVDWNRYV